MSGKILQVLDYGHREWVLGGIFRELNANSDSFKRRQVYLVPPNSLKNLITWFFQVIYILLHKRILFSSLTPLENFVRFTCPKRKKIGLWFTHKQGEFNSQELRALALVSTLFLHSSRDMSCLNEVTTAKVIVMMGAIDPERFKRKAKLSEQIVWVGTCVNRKNPELFLELVQALPGQKFRLIGKDWVNSKYWSQIESLPNLEYVEIHGALTSDSFNECDIFVVTSRIEGGPMPLMEAVSAGLFPISTDVGFVDLIFKVTNTPTRFIVADNKESFIEAISDARVLLAKECFPNREELLTYDFKRLAETVKRGMS